MRPPVAPFAASTGRRRAFTWIAAAAAALAIGVASFVGFEAVRGRPLLGASTGAATAAPPSPSPAVPASVAPAPPAPSRPGPPAEPAPALPADALVGGRTVRWWQERLELLRRSSDEASRELFRATVSRAEANGLAIQVDGDAVRVTVSEKTANERTAHP